MEAAPTVGALVLQLLIIGSFGWVIKTFLNALGRREFASFVWIIVIVLCASWALQAAAGVVEGIKSFFENFLPNLIKRGN